MKLLRFFLLFYTGTLLWFFSGCNDAPDSVGATTQPAGDYGTVQIDTFYTTVEQPSQTTLLFTNSIDRVMLGKYQANQGQTYEAWTCLKFYSWPDSLFGVRITSAALQLKPFYRFGDTTSSIDIDVFRAIASLQGDSLTFDSINQNGSHYYDGTRINTPVTLRANDTLCSINLDTSVVRQWFISNIDTTNRNDGLLLKPTGVSNIIKGFYSCNASDTASIPTLFVTYIGTNGVTGLYTHKLGLSKYVAHVDPNLFMNNPDGKIRVQNGISYRSLLSIGTSLDKLSKLWPITIHRAVLQLTIDSASSSCSYPSTPFSQDILYGLSVGSNDKPDGLYYITSEKLTNNAIYQFNVPAFTSGWIKNTFARKIMLSGFFESGSFDLFTFYGAGSTIAQRPKIIITYSIKR